MREQPKKSVRGPSRANGSALRVSCVFAGDAAKDIREMHKSGRFGPTLPLVVEGLALAEVRRHLLDKMRLDQHVTALETDYATAVADLAKESDQRKRLARMVRMLAMKLARAEKDAKKAWKAAGPVARASR